MVVGVGGCVELPEVGVDGVVGLAQPASNSKATANTQKTNSFFMFTLSSVLLSLSPFIR
jgi:hypothetical protein